ncbi:3-aminobutyryl-CoA ammonia-lyase [Streptomyces sp. SID8361]|uniref:hotdog domain-containing protein n=1 Tax=Streptomyces sp. MnatMP-M27 TaxID=1839768 RepID=UPI00081E2AE0|nr:hotdog domain-containing protein [Streptomyces sp. MnatMP-M27]MYU11085.1 3-aminobutyryl-CoA ammonia-lyase [Streptomyces sp. SID8361]SCF78154.1 3-aminobutyryl-CoA ammonia-lyase [Streptomyces sp. MnatMP-M27]
MTATSRGHVTATSQDHSCDQPGLVITHRRYVDYGAVHYAGNLAAGGYLVGLFGDVATDLCIHLDGDEGLFAAYSEVTFQAPLLAGDVIEVSAEVTRVGRRSRTIVFNAVAIARAVPEEGATVSRPLAEPITLATATGTVVVPRPKQERGREHD